MKSPHLPTKPLIALVLALWSATAFAEDTYECFDSTPFVVHQDVKLKCDGSRDFTMSHTGQFVALSGSELKDIELTFNHPDDNMIVEEMYLRNSTIKLENGASLTIDHAGGQLVLLDHSIIDVGDKSIFHVSSYFYNDHYTHDTRVVLRKGSTLDISSPDVDDKIYWEITGPTTIILNATFDPNATPYPKPLPDPLIQAMDHDVTLVLKAQSFNKEMLGHVGVLDMQIPKLSTKVLPPKTLMHESAEIFYSGDQVEAVQNIVMPKLDQASQYSATLYLTGMLSDAVNLSAISGTNNYLVLNGATRYRRFSSTNDNLLITDSQHTDPLHYVGDSTEGFNRVYLLGESEDEPAVLEIHHSLSTPVDFSLIPTGKYYKSQQDPTEQNKRYYIHGKIRIQDGETVVSKFSDKLPIEVVKHGTLIWNQADNTPFKRKINGQPAVDGDGKIMLNAVNPTWGTDAFAKTRLTMVFGNPDHTSNAAPNTHKVSSLPLFFGVEENTILSYDYDQLTLTYGSHPSFVNGTLLPHNIDFQVIKNNHNYSPSGLVWEIDAGKGSMVLNTREIKHAELLIDYAGGEFMVLIAPKTFHVVLEGDKTVMLRGKKYQYSIETQDTSSNDQKSFSLHLEEIRDMTTSGEGASNTALGALLSQAQPAIEAQIRLDLSRLNRELWHPERSALHTQRTMPEGLDSWIKVIGSYQKTSSMGSTPNHEAQSAYAAGIHLGGSYQWHARIPGETIALSLATEYLGGERTVGDVAFKERRWNSGLGLRVQKDNVYGAVSAQWTKVWHQPRQQNVSTAERQQHALELSAETGLNLHLTSKADLMPFVQYNWTHFDQTWDASEPSQHHLQLGAYLTMPWTSAEGIMVSNRLGVSTLLSILANDTPSFQATWSLRLSRGKGLGIQLQTTAEYAPSTERRRAVEFSLGADYAF